MVELITHFNIKPMENLILFTGPANGTFNYESVLAHHKQFNELYKNTSLSRGDGVLWMCETLRKSDIQRMILRYNAKVKTLTEWIGKTPYEIWTVLDKERHYYLCKLQLLRLALEECSKKYEYAMK